MPQNEIQEKIAKLTKNLESKDIQTMPARVKAISKRKELVKFLDRRNKFLDEIFETKMKEQNLKVTCNKGTL